MSGPAIRWSPTFPLSIITKADMMVAALNSVAARSNLDSMVEFQAGMAESASLAEQIARDIELFRIRYQANTQPGENARLVALANSYKALGRELTKIPHPNPFASSTPKTPTKQNGARNGPATIQQTTTTTKRPESEKRPSGPNTGAILGAVAIAGAAAAGWFLTRPQQPKTPVKPSPSVKPPASVATISSGGSPSAKPSTPSPQELAKEILEKNQDAVTESAGKAARQDAHQAALESGDLSSNQKDRITLAAIKKAYKEKLSATDYMKVSEGLQSWTLDHLKDLAPTVVATVQGNAETGSR